MLYPAELRRHIFPKRLRRFGSLQSAAAHSGLHEMPSHVCALSSIFVHVHAAAENDPTPLPPRGKGYLPADCTFFVFGCQYDCKAKHRHRSLCRCY